MKILCLVGEIHQDSNSSITSSIPSVRLRAILPMMELKKRGHHIVMCNIDDESTVNDILKRVDCVFLFKMLGNTRPRLVDALGQSKLPILCDICDDPETIPTINTKRIYEEISEVVTVYVAASPFLQQKLETRTTKPVHLVPEMIDRPPLSPHPWDGQSTLRIVWFGVLGPNFDYLEKMLPSLFERIKVPFRLYVVTNYSPRLKNAAENFAGMNVKIILWSDEKLSEILSKAHLTIVPSSDDTFNQAKTINRPMTALLSGINCVLYPLPSYKELAPFVELNSDIIEGVEDYLKLSVQERTRKILDAQKYLTQKYSSDNITNALENALRVAQKFAQKTPRVISSESSRILKLNLGCGNKILPGYINVDAVNRPGVDMVADIRDMKELIKTDTIHEILSVHVVEHFYEWEVRDLLREWIRMLRPGGKLILETPNLLSACREILSNPENIRADVRGQRTMWCLYGDPQHKDPLMCHKWLYTPDTLISLLEECGLEDIRQEPAKFKLKEPRDMRIIGHKKMK